MEKEKVKNSLNGSLSGNFYRYPDSLRFSRDLAFFIAKDLKHKYLGIIGPREKIGESGLTEQVSGDINTSRTSDDYIIRLYKRNNNNLNILYAIFPELYPVPLGMDTSFGFGDRLGLANAAHIRVIKKQKGILPVLAQQSVRELLKTGKDFGTVISNSVWNIMQEGYVGRWGADADHIKDKEYFIKAVEAGMTMFTLDTSDYLDEKALNMSKSKISEIYDLETDNMKNMLERYHGKKVEIDGFLIDFDEETVIRLALVYGKALDFSKDIFNFLSDRLDSFDYEVSFDETNTVTTPEAHFFIVNEMQRSEVDFTSLALRFPGTFEKGIDYLGNIEEFDESIRIHSLISRKIGGYKLSLHSGSDKLSIYPSFARHTRGIFHIKTSGTSWLEEVRLAAFSDPKFFKELFGIAYNTFDENKKAYHVGLDKDTLPDSLEDVKNEKLPERLGDNDLRRMFHIAYGAILGREKERMIELIFQNEQKHYDYLLKNFTRHFDALKNC